MNIFSQLKKHKKKATRILNFKSPKEGAKNLCRKLKIDKVRNVIYNNNQLNCWFVYNQLQKKFPENFSDFFTLSTQLHHDNTSGNKLIIPNVNTTAYG